MSQILGSSRTLKSQSIPGIRCSLQMYCCNISVPDIGAISVAKTPGIRPYTPPSLRWGRRPFHSQNMGLLDPLHQFGCSSGAVETRLRGSSARRSTRTDGTVGCGGRHDRHLILRSSIVLHWDDCSMHQRPVRNRTGLQMSVTQRGRFDVPVSIGAAVRLTRLPGPAVRSLLQWPRRTFPTSSSYPRV